jgi:hypothetical protein
MKLIFILAVLLTGFLTNIHAATTSKLKPRMVVLTDISTWEPDDNESLIRLMAYADMFEIEGIIVTTGWSMDNVNFHTDFINIAIGVISNYEKDLPNLMKRSNQSGNLHDNEPQEIGYWPSAKYLRDRTMFGSMLMGQKYIGEGNDSKGSKLIIDLADADDDRPLWIATWGGANTLAQAIWRVQKDRTPEELKAFLNKIRIYTITDQDRGQNTAYDISSHQLLRKNFADDLKFLWDECAWGYQNGTGKNNWNDYATNIQNHGYLGAGYPKYAYGVEGDTPSFLYLLPNGLSNPDVPNQAGFGGYFAWGLGKDNLTSCYTNHTGSGYSTCYKYVSQFYPAIFNDFAARMDWAKDGAGNRNPIIDVDGNKGNEILINNSEPGSSAELDASATTDPDNNSLTYKWWIMPESGIYLGNVSISNSTSSKATVLVPSNSVGKSFHIICEVTDNGTPNLKSYRRIIFEPVVGAKPIIKITSPASGTSFNDPAEITLTAEASDSDGNIAIVEFFQGTISLGKVTSAPFTLKWNNVMAKVYTITAKAIDNSGNPVTSDPLLISVKNITGIEPLVKDALEIYPNPATDQLNIKSDIEFNDLKIFNLEGKLVCNQKFSNPSYYASVHLNMAKGIYLLDVSNSKTSKYSKFLIK